MQNNNGETTANCVTVDTKKADNILRWLIRCEAENVRTKARNDSQMISEIQKRIQEEAICY